MYSNVFPMTIQRRALALNTWFKIETGGIEEYMSIVFTPSHVNRSSISKNKKKEKKKYITFRRFFETKNLFSLNIYINIHVRVKCPSLISREWILHWRNTSEFSIVKGWMMNRSNYWRNEIRNSWNRFIAFWIVFGSFRIIWNIINDRCAD